ncbi:MAG: hypothetical protein WCI05_13890, partial [Myxococcales bacterium]
DTAVSGKTKSLSAYYFDSSSTAYAGVAGTYTVALWVKDTSAQTASKTFTVSVTSAAVDDLPSVSGASLASSVTTPNKIYFSGNATDDIGLTTITMMVSGPKGNNLTAFSDTAVSGKTKSLSAYYFDSSSTAYAGVAGTYTVALWVKDTSAQTASKTFTVTVR